MLVNLPFGVRRDGQPAARSTGELGAAAAVFHSPMRRPRPLESSDSSDVRSDDPLVRVIFVFHPRVNSELRR